MIDAVRSDRSRFIAATLLGGCLFVVALVVLAGIGNRLAWWGFGAVFPVLQVLVPAAGLLVLTALALLAVMLARGTGPVHLPVLAVLVTLPVVLISGHAAVAVQSGRVPMIHDITTDTTDPPRFRALRAVRRAAPNRVAYAGEEIARIQRRAYPDLRTMVVPFDRDRLFQLCLALAGERGWKVVSAQPAAGIIEATDTTFWFGFRDDVVIRLRQGPKGVRVDLRSASRVGRSDLGTNAARIRSFLRDLRRRVQLRSLLEESAAGPPA